MTGRQSSLVDRALALVDRGRPAHAVARKLGLAVSTVYRALKRRRERQAARSAVDSA